MNLSDHIHHPHQPTDRKPDHHTSRSCSDNLISSVLSYDYEQGHHDQSAYGETPSSEPFNVDPDLREILNKNHEIIQRSEPRFVTYPTATTDEEKENQDPNNSLIHIIARTELNKLGRFQESERLYFKQYSQVIKRKYSSSCAYLNQRLKFITPPAHQAHLFVDQNQNPITHFSSSSTLKDGVDYRVIKNEWPYAIPRDYQHMIVWSRLPLINPKLARSPTELKIAYKKGLSGFENLRPDFVGQLNRYGLNPDGRFRAYDEAELSSLNDIQQNGLEKVSLDQEITNFIRTRWPFDDGFVDLMWFLNPVYLQSCPELPHFHVFVKKINP